MVLVPIPGKDAKYTSFAFEQAVLGRFGSCGEVCSDQGKEWLGAFQATLARSFIDQRTTAPNHPQANGLTERCVQTVKRCLRRHCEDSYTINTWDEQLPYISLGYNCSKQKSTNCSPYQLLYAREPFIPSPIRERMTPTLDYDTPAVQEQIALELITRAEYLQRAMPTIASNLSIAQHRDKRLYQKRRDGNYTVALHKYNKGDYVYLRRAKQTSTLQIKASQLILRVLELRTNGAVLLQGRCGATILNNVVNLAPCHLPNIDGTIQHHLAKPHRDLACEVCNMPDDEALMLLCDGCGNGWHSYCLRIPLDHVPEGDFLCDNCITAGITLKMVARAKAAKPTGERPDMDKLFPDKAMRGRDAQAESYDGRLIARKKPDRHGDVPTTWGTVAYRGADMRPLYFLVRYDDDTEEIMSLTTLRKRNPMPQGSVRPIAHHS